MQLKKLQVKPPIQEGCSGLSGMRDFFLAIHLLPPPSTLSCRQTMNLMLFARTENAPHLGLGWAGKTGKRVVVRAADDDDRPNAIACDENKPTFTWTWDCCYFFFFTLISWKTPIQPSLPTSPMLFKFDGIRYFPVLSALVAAAVESWECLHSEPNRRGSRFSEIIFRLRPALELHITKPPSAGSVWHRFEMKCISSISDYTEQNRSISIATSRRRRSQLNGFPLITDFSTHQRNHHHPSEMRVLVWTLLWRG